MTSKHAFSAIYLAGEVKRVLDGLDISFESSVLTVFNRYQISNSQRAELEREIRSILLPAVESPLPRSDDVSNGEFDGLTEEEIYQKLANANW